MIRATTRELEHLRQLLLRRGAAVDAGMLAAEGFGEQADSLADLFGDLPAKRAVALVEAVLAERSATKRTELELVWTGPEAAVATSRDTAVLVQELFGSAERHVLLAGYSFTDGAKLFAPLHERMANAGVRAEFFVDIESDPLVGEAAAAHAARWFREFLRMQWPFGPPYPSCYYHPENAGYGHDSSLHAKCLVIDGAKTLVTSANFTRSGQGRNIEMGVVVHDGDFATRVVGQWSRLAAMGLVVRLQ